jgi:hypothetical protein
VKSLLKQGYKINLYDGCMANKVIEGMQLTICFHIDDCKISRESSKVIDDTIDWLRSEYDSTVEDGSGAMKCIMVRYTNTLACRMTSPVFSILCIHV